MKHGRWWLLAVLVVGVFVADQVTKYRAVGALTRVFDEKGALTTSDRLRVFLGEKGLEDRRRRPVPVFPDHLHLKYVENPGAAWGVLGTADERVRMPFFYLVSIVAITFILLFYRRLADHQRVLRVAMGLVLGGALGNFADRVLRGYVIDFLDLHWRNHPALHWPTFNVADVGISLGVALMLAETLLAPRPREESPGEREHGAPEPAPPEPAAPDAAPREDPASAERRAGEP